MKYIKFIFFLFLLGLSSCAKDIVDLTCTIEGVVKDEDSGLSLANCEVQIMPSNYSITTASDGFYTFTGLEAGTYTVTYNRSGYISDSRTVILKAGETTRIEMMLKAKSSFSLSENLYDFGDLESSKTFVCFNNSSSDCSYTISDLPEWIIANKSSGTVKANSSDSFILTIDRSKVGIGQYNHNVAINYSGQKSGTEIILIKMSKVEYTTPSVTTASQSSSVGETGFSIEGTITATGGSQVTSYGHCWSTNQNPTINDQCTNLGMTNKICTFKSTIEDLSVNTTYYVRAYATNSQGTSYGEQTIIKTKAAEGSGPWDGEIASSFAGGSGTAIDPYIVKTGGQLLLMKEYSDKYFKLANDIDLNNNNWLPFIFKGNLNGNGNTIYNLKISRPKDNQGLFSELSGTVENIKIDGVSINAPQYSNIGVIAGVATNAVINNCEIVIDNVVLGNENVGGTVGIFNGPDVKLSNCKINGKSNGQIKGNRFIGGIVGCLNNPQIYNTKTDNNHVNIDVEGYCYIGGCYGCITTRSSIVCANIYKHSYRGRIKGSTQIGGILGITYGETDILACKTNVEIEVVDNSEGQGIGGILGSSSVNSYGGCDIACCYSTGNINYSGNYGGIVDYKTFSSTRTEINIYHCYTTINDGIDYINGGTYNDLEESISVYETSDVSKTMSEFYSKYAEYWNYKNTWIWNGEVNGVQVSIPCPKLAWE